MLKQVKLFLERTKADVAYGNIIQIHGNEKKTIRTYGKACSQKIYFLSGDCICHQAMFAKRELFSEKKFDTQYKVCADKEWQLYHICNHKVFMPMGFEIATVPVEGFSTKHFTDFDQIVLVGLSKQQIKNMPQNVTGICRTENKDELAKLYSMAHIFVNPSVEESFSFVTVEALACGTPIIVLDTSAVKDFVYQENGMVLHAPDPEDYLDAIRNIEEKKAARDAIRSTALQYDVNQYGERIMELYEQQQIYDNYGVL